MNVWSDPVTDPLLIPLVDVATMTDQGNQLLAERLAGWAEKYPDVAVERVVVRGRPAHALLTAAERGQLLHRSPCPVAVARA